MTRPQAPWIAPWVIGLSCAAVAACEFGDPLTYPEAGNYSPYPVYGAYLEEREARGDVYVVLTPTRPYPDPSGYPTFDADPSAAESYRRRLETASILDEERFRIGSPVIVTTDEAIDDLTEDERGCHWERFEAEYPLADGVESFSDVGFSNDGREAVVCAFHNDGCGFGYFGCAQLVRQRADSPDWTLELYIPISDG